nr:RNA-directed DNA polymerase, eukaryota [Tanacetum cinerariifolium]
MNKLKYLKEKIRIWARLHKESLNSRKSIFKAELADLDGVIDKGEGSDADGHRRREVVRLIQEVEKVDAMEVAQKAKIKWSIEGDENSKYYHGVLNKKRGRLTIRGVLVDGIWMESPHLVKHEFFEHFKNRFEKPNKSSILLERDFVKRISLEQNDDLKREVSNEETKRAVWDCDIDKAPRPDGFTFGFYRRYWDIIGNDNKKKQSMIFKVDLKKAYNLVRWDFIDDILRRFGFGEKWCKWIQSCLYSSRGSVLVNESPMKEFQFHEGLKQGALLYPFLFILVMESLHVSFQRVVDAGLRINMNKINLMGISVDSNKVKHVAAKIGEGSDADGHRRREVVRLIQEVEKVDAMKVAQKAKIKWSIEGDENSKYYHGNDDLEREVSNEEIKMTVWDCDIDKAPGSDGFTFGFYQRYWDIIGNDV